MPSLDQFKEFSFEIIQYAKQKGASDVAVDLSAFSGKSVSVRNQNIENLEHYEERSACIGVYLGKKHAKANCSLLCLDALKETADAALHIAHFSAEDSCAGLPDEADIVQNCVDLNLHHRQNITMENAIEMAMQTEKFALDYSDKIQNSEGAHFSIHDGFFLSTHTHGFSQGFPYSRYSLSASVIAQENNAMQADSWFDSHCNLDKLQSAQTIGKTAAQRALSRLNPKKIKMGVYPVLFENTTALSLLSHFVQAASGGNLYRGASFLLNQKDKTVFSKKVHIVENPFLKEHLSSSCFDDEGVATKKQSIVDAGVLKTYFLSSYSARKLNLKPTGHAGGVHNLAMLPKEKSFSELVKTMNQGLIVTELLGQGVNLITGDYSRGASGFWVENGEIVHPVEEITIAGNLKEMFLDVVDLGNDVLVRGAKSCPSLLIEKMTVAA